MSNSSVISINDASFENEVLQCSLPVLVDFWATWCAPCKMLAPILEELAVVYSDKLKICKLNVDENEQAPIQYGIRSLPTLMLFKDGKAQETKLGALSKSQLDEFLKDHVS